MKFENYLCLEASAGSGKTFALSVRYIALLLKGNHPRKILALTFTNKAANEMKHRITDTFCNLDSSECDGERNAICELLGKSKEEILALRDKFMADFLSSELKISTFDSFFATILRQFSLNLGLMPDFNSLNDNSIEVKNEFKRLLNSNSMMSKVAKYLYYTNSKENALFEKLALLSQTKFDKFDAPWPNPKNAMDRYNALCDVALKLSSDGNYVKNFNKNLSLNEIVEKAVVKDKDMKKKYFDKVKDNAEFNAARDEFISALKEYYIALEKYEISQISYFVDLYKKAIANVNRRENSLSFADITNWVNELLTSKNKQNIDMLYFRLDAKIRHILIDEFQDTDIKQYEILEPLIAESLSGIGQSGLGSFFYVGDIKQSIYRFRGGQSELFNKLKEDFSQIKAQSLDKNYRSDKEIVEYVNNRFKDKYPHYIDQIPNSKENGYVRVIKFDREKYLEAIYDSIKKLEDNRIEHKDMAILCWKNSDIYNIKDYLEDKGLEVSTQTTNNLIKSANVAAVVAFLKYSIFGDRIYLNAQYEITKTKKAKLELKSDASVAQTLKFIAKYLELEPCDIDLLKLYEISSKYSDIYDFAFNIDNDQTTSAKNSQKGITIMTVHKSKGLQFDHVIVLDYIGKENSQKDKFLMEYNLGTNSWDIRLANKVFEYLGDADYTKLQDRQKELDRKEVINKIYVALTRAKHSLIILAKDNPNGNNISYFTEYESNGKTVEYLNLDECKLGIIEPNSDKKQEPKSQITHLKPFEKIAPQEILTSDKPKESLNLDSIYFGKALHYYLESIDFADFNSLKIAQNCLYNKFGAFIDQDGLKDIKDRVDRLLNNPQFLEIIKDKRLYQEQDIGFNGALKRIDLLCVNNDEIEIIDYKSSLKNSDEHKEQVREYLDILSQIYPQKKLKASIVYILHDKIQISKL
ncbi:putative recombination protein RecB [Campylobacter devanensis]|uniref:DNA 3'-5' helicase n=1 Tax=Campylobacter devanensis TaxID=3161138 RepID=A0A1X9SR80_9BACT|nr:RecB-like helicase [Campylobacter lanienae]ARQ98756.1 exonuclease V, helicase AddA [Campylobacter lanienae]SUX01821.1 putative recombination protein RecB [Campylobacter lanienae]